VEAFIIGLPFGIVYGLKANRPCHPQPQLNSYDDNDWPTRRAAILKYNNRGHAFSIDLRDLGRIAIEYRLRKFVCIVRTC
jgi:hypothetical protein